MKVNIVKNFIANPKLRSTYSTNHGNNMKVNIVKNFIVTPK